MGDDCETVKKRREAEEESTQSLNHMAKGRAIASRASTL